MFIGHFGVGLAAKGLAARTSLGTLFFAAQFLDLVWPVLLLLGLEHVRIAPGITRMSPFDFYDYPISHSLASAAMWCLVVGAAYYTVRRNAHDAMIVGLAVVSHWALDLVVHRPDLPLWPGGPNVGWGLWNYWIPEIVVEGATFAAGIWMYSTVTRARDGLGRYAFWTLMGFLFCGWVASLLAGAPPNEQAMAWGALGMWIVMPWAWWADRHRQIIA
jgi:hypothetical protein